MFCKVVGFIRKREIHFLTPVTVSMNVWIRQEAWMWRYSEYPARSVDANYGMNEYGGILFDVVAVQVVFDVASISSCSIVTLSLVRVSMHHVS